MENSQVSQKQVVEANRRLYDAVAHTYEEVDGRRSVQLEQWLRERLRGIRNRCPGDMLLDIGAGSGLVSRCAEGVV